MLSVIADHFLDIYLSHKFSSEVSQWVGALVATIPFMILMVIEWKRDEELKKLKAKVSATESRLKQIEKSKSRKK